MRKFTSCIYSDGKWKIGKIVVGLSKSVLATNSNEIFMTSDNFAISTYGSGGNLNYDAYIANLEPMLVSNGEAFYDNNGEEFIVHQN